MKKDFMVMIESIHLPDNGEKTNVSKAIYSPINLCSLFSLLFSLNRLINLVIVVDKTMFHLRTGDGAN